ncbi:12372_t:CDS:2, partial [Entrophospora sp. SA101]
MVIANLKALAYNILKEFKDPIVSGKDLSELNCSECDKKIISSPHIKYFTTLKCGHTFHRLCLKKKILLAYPNVCPYPNCNEKLDLIEFPRCDSESKVGENTNNFLYHYSKITHAESKSEIANGEVIECYFNF